MEASSPDPIYDPRDFVTEHAFRVAPDLLGRPLATPWRRLAAIAVDGIAIAFLANAPGLIFAVAVAFLLLRIAIRPAAGGVVKRSARMATRALAAVVAFGVAISLWGALADRFDGEDELDDVRTSDVAFEAGGVELTGIQGLVAGAQVLGVVRSENEAEATEALERLVAELNGAGVRSSEILAVLTDVQDSEPDRPWVRAAVDSMVVRLEAEAAEEERADSLLAEGGDAALAAYVEAAQRGDSIRMAELRQELPVLLAAERIEALSEEAASEATRRRALEEAIEEAEEGRGILGTFRTLANDLGLTFGWSSLYFVGFTVLWRGQTPGKRLFGTRSVRLDGRPIGWWNAFERFAGYAAGVATGLLGFIQMFWDRNRQGIQDKIAGTVVVRE